MAKAAAQLHLKLEALYLLMLFTAYPRALLAALFTRPQREAITAVNPVPAES